MVIFAAVGGTFLFIILCIIVYGVYEPIGAAVWKLMGRAWGATGRRRRIRRARQGEEGAGGIELSVLGQGGSGGDAGAVGGAGQQGGAPVVGEGDSHDGQLQGGDTEDGDVSVRQVDGDYRRQGLVE